MRNKFLKTFFYLCLGVIIFCGCKSKITETTQPPNVVIILIDTLRARSMSCYGYHRKTSPNIDAFANKNLLFLNAYTVATSTPPSIAALMTGKFPYYSKGTEWNVLTYFGMNRFYKDGEQKGLPYSLDTLAELFRDAGYSTAGIITNPYAKRIYHFDQGFEFYKELFQKNRLKYGLAEDVSKEAINWLRKNQSEPFSIMKKRNKPFFLYLHYMDVHGPYYPPEKYRKIFKFPSVAGEDPIDLNSIWHSEKNLTDSKYKNLKAQMMGLYDSSIYYTDHYIQNILSFLENHKLMDNTIVAILADHGEEFLEHGRTTHKGTFYDEMIHIPLILHIPDVNHKIIKNPVRTFDLMPTLLSYAGISYEVNSLDAINLRPIIEEKIENIQLPIFTTFLHQLSLKDQQFKLIYRTTHPQNSQLYDLTNDPDEKNNLYNVSSYKIKATELNKQINDIVIKINKAGNISDPSKKIRGKKAGTDRNASEKKILLKEDSVIDKETLKQLKSLGYTE